MLKKILFFSFVFLFLISFTFSIPKDMGYILNHNTSTSSLENITNFLDLLDTPSSYAGEGGNCVAVNGGETGLEFIACGGGTGDFSFTDFQSSFNSNITNYQYNYNQTQPAIDTLNNTYGKFWYNMSEGVSGGIWDNQSDTAYFYNNVSVGGNLSVGDKIMVGSDNSNTLRNINLNINPKSTNGIFIGNSTVNTSMAYSTNPGGVDYPVISGVDSDGNNILYIGHEVSILGAVPTLTFNVFGAVTKSIALGNAGLYANTNLSTLGYLNGSELCIEGNCISSWGDVNNSYNATYESTYNSTYQSYNDTFGKFWYNQSLNVPANSTTLTISNITNFNYNYNQTDTAYFYNMTDHKYFYNQTDTAYFYNMTDTKYFYNQTVNYWNVSNSKIVPYDLSADVNVTSNLVVEGIINASFGSKIGEDDMHASIDYLDVYLGPYGGSYYGSTPLISGNANGSLGDSFATYESLIITNKSGEDDVLELAFNDNYLYSRGVIKYNLTQKSFSINSADTGGNNRVGIGTDNPSQPLTVFTDSGSTTGLNVTAGANGVPIAKFERVSSDAWVGISASGLDPQIKFQDANANWSIGHDASENAFKFAFNDRIGHVNDLVRINGTGHVGIGTSTPRTLLSVESASSSDPSFIDIGTNNKFRHFRMGINGSDTAEISWDDGDELNFGIITDADDFTQTPRVTFKGSGEVGIGTTRPSHTLTVDGDTSISGSLLLGGASKTTGISLSADGSSFSAEFLNDVWIKDDIKTNYGDALDAEIYYDSADDKLVIKNT